MTKKTSVRPFSSKETLELILLSIISQKPRPAAGILRKLEKVGLSMPRGTVYASLSGLHQRHLISRGMEELEDGSGRVCYALAEPGQKHIADLSANWNQTAEIIARLSTNPSKDLRSASAISPASGR